MTEAVSHIEDIARHIQQNSDSVAGLSKRTEEATAAVELINRITEQTNLLALNAAIEAARSLRVIWASAH